MEKKHFKPKDIGSIYTYFNIALRIHIYKDRLFPVTAVLHMQSGFWFAIKFLSHSVHFRVFYYRGFCGMRVAH